MKGILHFAIVRNFSCLFKKQCKKCKPEKHILFRFELETVALRAILVVVTTQTSRYVSPRKLVFQKYVSIFHCAVHEKSAALTA